MTAVARRIGVALSGGGVRAAAFHLGVLSKLYDLGVLPLVDIISTVSGGSIAGAAFLLNGTDFPAFKDAMIRALQSSIELRILFNWRAPLLLKPGYSLTDIKAAVYDDIFFSGKTLSALRKRPKLIINSTNLVTGKNFKLSQDFLGDWKTGYDGLPSVMKISTAVAASTAVPGLFKPIRIKTATYFPQPRVKAPVLALCDGGVYDNQGTHTLTSDYDRGERCTHILCSDASAPFPDNVEAPPLRAISVLRRQSDVMMARIKNIQFQQLLYGEFATSIKAAYFSIDWTYGGLLTRVAKDKPRCAALGISDEMDALARLFQSPTSAPAAVADATRAVLAKLGIAASSTPLADAAAAKVSAIGTRLRALSADEVSLLLQHGATLCELQLRLYLADLLPSVQSSSSANLESREPGFAAPAGGSRALLASSDDRD